MSISNTFVNKVDLIFTHTVDNEQLQKDWLSQRVSITLSFTFLSLKTLIYVSKTIQMIANKINSHSTRDQTKIIALEILILKFYISWLPLFGFHFFKRQMHVCMYYSDTLALVITLFSGKVSCRSIP